MTITRKLFKIFRIRIRLSDSELYTAYAEQKHRFDMEDIRCKIESRWDEDEKPEVLNNPVVISDIADRFRKYLDNNDSISESLWMCADWAIDDELIGESK